MIGTWEAIMRRRRQHRLRLPAEVAKQQLMAAL